MSFLLCAFLMAATLAIFMPDLISPVLVNRWRKKNHYWRR
jgi:hypothetical protein